MGLRHTFGGSIRVRITSADTASLLRQLQEMQISLQTVEPEDSLQLSACIQRRQLPFVERLCRKRGEQLEILEKAGVYWTLRDLLRRPVLILGLLGILMLSIWVQGRVLFVIVEGNQTVSSKRILEAAAECGVDFGSGRRELRNEKIKNSLIAQIPQLQWVGVNTQGCVAVISVRERTEADRKEAPYTVSSLVAHRDAVIQQITVLNGTVQCKPGDRVVAGQVLISGFTDCGLCIRAGNAEGEIYGNTERYLTALLPAQGQCRGECLDSEKNFSLIIGKKRINLQNSSGISGAECVRIYSEYYITLPGGFQLPVAVGIEQLIWYAARDCDVTEPEEQLLPLMQASIQSEMVAGQICQSEHILSRMDGVYRMDAIYQCCEMIGRVRPEECLQDYEDH